MSQPATQADLWAHLREHCIEGVSDPFERIRTYMDGVSEDLASAADDLKASRSRTMASDIEDAAMLMGEAIGYAYGFKVPAGEGHHWKSIQILSLFLRSSVPSLRAQASQMELLRVYRHQVKYDGADAPMSRTKAYYGMVREIYDTIKGEPLRILSQRQGQRGS